MPAVRDSLAGDALKHAVVRAVAPQHLLSEPALVRRFDLATMAASDQDFTAPFRLTVGAGALQQGGWRALEWVAGACKEGMHAALSGCCLCTYACWP